MNAPRCFPFFYFVAALVLFAAFLGAGESAAQAQDAIALEAQAGLDGLCKTDSWLSVRVKVENSGADAEARLLVSYENQQGGYSIFAVQPLALPSASRKEFFFYFPASFTRKQIFVRLMQGETELAKKSLNVSCGKADDLHLALLSETPAAFNSLAGLSAISGGKTRLAQLTPADLPDQPQGLDALDALVIANADTGALSAEQRRAILLWAAEGGTLFVAGGSNWQATTAGLGDLLPLEISSVSSAADWSALTAYVGAEAPPAGEAALAVGALSKGAKVLIEQDGLPLLAEKRLGFGRVYYFSADPTLQPFSRWDGMNALYQHLLTFYPQKPVWAQPQWDRYEAQAALAAIPELKLPNFFYLCCWLGVYIAAIGPINYLVLRRLKRMELAWATIPALAALFSCAAYVAGLSYRNDTPLFNRLAVTQSWDGAPYAHSAGLIGLYSPARASYDIQARDGFHFYSPNQFDSSLQGDADWLQVTNNQGETLPGARVDVADMAVFGADGYLPALQIRHDLKLALTRSVPQLSGTITNDSAYLLQDAVLITPYDWEPLGDLAPNQSKKVSRPVYGLNAEINSRSLFNDLGLSFYPSGGDEIDAKRRRAFLRAGLFNDENVNASGGFYLFAWVDGLSAPVELANQKSRAMDGAAYLLKMEPEFAADSGEFALNAGAYEWFSSMGALAAQIPTDGYEVWMRPAAPLHFRIVKTLEVKVVSSGSANSVKGYLWNFESLDWDEIPNLSQSRMFNPKCCVGAGGELRFRFTVAPNDYGEINSINFELKVNP